MNKRQPYREYATEAFRLLGREGSKKAYIEKLVEDFKRGKGNGLSQPTESQAIHIDQVLTENYAIIEDLEAAETALMLCGEDVRKAVELVYMRDCWRELEWGDVGTRVTYATVNIPADRSQIYRWLAKARKEFARERGLRI